jgi:CheY-like chemotaxis protein/MinD-like ATPase involved in chromosome partitioning or flagellar assembly
MTHKLLIVDDHPETLDIISRVLRQQGYAVTPTSSGVQGLALAESEMPDLILLDGMMPDMDGWEVCRRIRQNPKIAQTPIIMFSAINEAEQKLAGFNAGADDYLTKPTEPVELIERVRALLEDVPPRPELVAGLVAELPAVTPPASSSMMGGRTVALPGSNQVVAIVGVRGGAGTTLLAINLAVSLATSDHKVTLVDLDVSQGHVGYYLNQKVSNGLNKLARLPEGMLAQNVPARLMPYNDYLSLLLTENNLMGAADVPSPNQVSEIMELLTMVGGSVIVDCGMGVTAVNRPVLEQADQIVLCVPPERVGLAAAKQFLPQLQETLFPHTQLSIVLLEFSGNMNVPQQAIESFLGVPVTAVVPFLPQELRRAVNKNVPLVQLQPDAKASGVISGLARQLAKS